MMLQPSEEEIKLYEKLNAAKSETEREEATEKLRAYLLGKKRRIKRLPICSLRYHQSRGRWYFCVYF